ELHHTGIYRRCLAAFGTLTHALQLAKIEGWPHRFRRGLLSRSGTLDALLGLRESGVDLKRAIVRRTEPHLLRSIDRNFGSWAEALAALESLLMNTGK